MKRFLLVLLCMNLTIIIGGCSMLKNEYVNFAATDTNSDAGNAKILVEKFAETINNNDVDTYISLFTASNQEEMKSYIERNGKTNTFRESHVELTNITKLSDKIEKRSASIADKEIENYSDLIVYYVEMNQEFKNGNGIEDDDILDNGYTYKVFVIVKENHEWKILRVSFPNIGLILDANEGFGADHEKAKMEYQKAKTNIPK